MTSPLQVGAFAAGAGAVNAGAFLACRTFVSHVTGTTTQVGLNAHTPVSVIEDGLVIVSFGVGAAIAAMWIGHAPKKHMHGPLGFVAASLCALAVIGALGGFGPFGAEPETARELSLVYALSAVMGLFNATVSLVTKGRTRVTHLSGAATDLPVLLARALTAKGSFARRAFLQRALGPGAALGGFLLGAIVMVQVAGLGSYLAFFFPAAMVVVGLSFKANQAPHLESRSPRSRRGADEAPVSQVS
jgi:uncharacterized membrane protein YoaK (UPF0700 family)